MTTVRELIEELKRVENQDLHVFMAADGEGNGYRPFGDVEVSEFHWDGNEPQPIHPDDLDDYYEDECEPGLFLWPAW